jgi:hypothetical protein
MAVLRCEKCGPPQGRRLSYASSHKLVSEATTRIFCGTAKCTELALNCWLTDEEEQQYLHGKRLFTVPPHQAAMVRLT